MKYSRVCLEALGHYLPERTISSAEIETQLSDVYQRLKLPEGRLELMSGITERRLWDDGTKPSDAAVKAGKIALEKSDVPVDDLGCLIFSSVSRDMMEPATANFVHAQLGLPETCSVFDISNACLGFLNSMTMLANMIELGQVKAGLIVAGETAEDLLRTTIDAINANPNLTRKSIKSYFASLTISSGSVALVMTDADYKDSGHRLLGGAIRSNTAQSHLCQGGNTAAGTLMETDSETLLHEGVGTAARTWPDFLANLSWTAQTAKYYFTHQVGRAHSKLLFDTLGIDESRSFVTLDRMGNNGSVAAPLALSLGAEEGLLNAGDKLALLGIGSGINCLMLGIEW